ncbi:MAG: 23S rRNA (pseudouridine(1915)-N(3))-methyltransferase RlmH [Clostridia bacterium]|nr:23S rRNA (pseudouridine(1915)-N(3))-methyltransferase RlmH [Clostridia bacterium]
MKITVICLGKLKEKYLSAACDEYRKRLSRYCSLDFVELDPVKLSDKPSKSEIDLALDKEADLILKKIPQNSEVYALCIEGKQLSSEALAEKVSALKNMGKSLTFVIGSSYGLSQKIKSLSQLKLSFSQMTFPHQLFRVMLLEQIYRAFKIDEGSEYHK